MRRIVPLLLALLTTGCGRTTTIPAQPERAQASEPARDRAEERDVADPKDKHTPTSDAFVYTAKIRDGKVFISLNTNSGPDGEIGPFVRISDDEFRRGTAWNDMDRLTRRSDGRWFYDWTYVQMSPQRVDGSVLKR